MTTEEREEIARLIPPAALAPAALARGPERDVDGVVHH